MSAKIIRLRAFALGVREGWRQPESLSSGITWTDGPWLEAGANDAFDHGANWGQFLHSPHRSQVTIGWKERRA